MKKAGSLLITSVFLFLIGCNKNDDTQTTSKDTIVGTWKLIERIENDRLIPLGICELKELYVFGPEQYSHETFRQDIKKYKSHQITTANKPVIFGSDDDYYTEIDNTVHCKSDGVVIGTWSKTGTDEYTLKGNTFSGSQEYAIYFSKDNKKFYLEKPVYLSGRPSISTFVYKRQ